MNLSNIKRKFYHLKRNVGKTMKILSKPHISVHRNIELEGNLEII